MLPRIWSRPLERMYALSLDDVEIAVRNDDGTLRELVMESGVSPPAEADLVTTLMRAGDIPTIAALAEESDHPAAEHLYLASGSRSQASSKERGPSKAITTAPQPRAIGCTSPAPLSTFRTPPMPVSETLICEGSPSAS